MSSGAASMAVADCGGGELAEGRQHGIHLEDVEIREQAAQQFAEGLAHGAAGAIGFFDEVGHFVAERQALDGRAKLAHGRIGQHHAADGLGAGGAPHFDLDGLVAGAEDPNVVDLGEIVILGGQPEDGHGGNAVFGKPCGHPDGVEHLVNCVGRPGKQPHLLTRYHRERSRLGQPLERLARRVFDRQGGDEGGAALGGEPDLRGCGLKGFEIAQGMAVKTGDAVRVIQHIREQGGGMRQVGMPDAGTVHARISLADENRVLEDSTVAGLVIETPPWDKGHNCSRSAARRRRRS